MPPITVPLLNPDVPARGMIPSQDPAMIEGGYWYRLQNVRTNGGTIQVRNGAVKRVSSGPGGTLKGYASVTLEGANYLVAAFRNAGTTNFYRLSGSSWTQFGAGSGFASDGDVTFCVVRDFGAGGITTAADVLVIQNGTDSPRVAYGLNFATVGTASAIGTPAWVTATPVPQGYAVLNTATGTHAYSTDSAFDMDVAATGPDLDFSGGAIAASSTADLTWDTSRDEEGSSFLVGIPVQKEFCIGLVQTNEETLVDYVSSIAALLDPATPVTFTVTGASTTTPIVVTVASTTGLSDGDYVRVTGVGGITEANGVWQIDSVTGTTFELVGSAGVGAWTSGGTVAKLEWVTIYDPTTDDADLTVQELGVSPLGGSPGVMLSILANQYEGRTGWNGIRFVSPAQTPPAFRSYIIFVGTSGQIDGRARWAGSYYSSTTRQEGIATEANNAAGVTLQAVGGATFAQGFRWTPDVGTYRTAWQLAIADKSGITGSPNYALFYRSDPYLASDDSTQFAPYWLSYWVALSAPGLGFTNQWVTDPLLYQTRYAKEAGHLTLPTGSLMAFVNDRLFLAGTSTPSAFWVSGWQDPFAFRLVPLVDDDGNQDQTSPTYRTYGGETVTALLRMQGDFYGVDTLYLWTNRGVYRMGGYDSRTLLQSATLSEKGTNRRQTVCAYDGTVWYLDTEGQVRSINGGLASDPRSMAKVDALLSAGTITSACAIVGYDAFRIFFQESGTASQLSCLVWQQQTGEWVIDKFPFTVAGAVVHETSPRRIMYAFESDGKLWELEVPGQTTEDGAQIVVSLVSRELSLKMWEPASFGRAGVILSSVTNATLGTSRYCPNDASTTTGTYSFTGSAAWNYDVTASSGVPGTPVNPSCLITWSGGIPGGVFVRSLNIAVSAASAGAKV